MELLVLAIPVLVVLWIRRDRRALAPEAGASILGAAGFRPDAHLEGAPAPWRSLVPLVRVEMGRLLRHPAPYLMFLPIAPIMVISSRYPSIRVESMADVEIPIYVVPFAWGAIVAANLTMLRSRRWRTDELLGALPVPSGSRTIAVGLASVALMLPALVILAGWQVLAWTAGRSIGSPRPVVLLVAPLLVLGGCCLGIAVARWLPRPGIAWLAVIATFVLQVNLGALDPRWRWLHFSMYASESLHHQDLAPTWHEWHAVYLVAGSLLVAALAVLRTRRDARVVAALVVAVVVLIGSGAWQVRPMSAAEVASFANRLEHPEQTQRCVAREAITYCGVDPVLDLVDAWDRPVRAVWQRVPASGRPAALTVRQRPLITAIAEVPSEVLAVVDPSRVWPDDREVSVSDEWAVPAPEHGDEPGRVELALAFRVASSTLGLAPDAHWETTARGAGGSDEWATGFLRTNLEDERGQGDPTAYHGTLPGPLVVCTTGEQARGVVALWLAGQATPAARETLRHWAGVLDATRDLDRTVVFDPGDSYREGLSGVVPENGTAVRARSIVIAARLLEQPDGDVARVLDEHWRDLRSATLSWDDAAGWFAPLGSNPLPIPPYDPTDEDPLGALAPPRPRFLAGLCEGERPDVAARP